MGMEKIGTALGRIPSGLFILTSHYQGHDEAILVSWVSQCSFEPPTLTVVLSQDRSAREIIKESQAFIINVLGKENLSLIKRFSKPVLSDSIFEGLEFRRGFGNSAILENTVAYMECEFLESIPATDHFIFLGKIIGGDLLKAGDPYIHIRKSGFSY